MSFPLNPPYAEITMYSGMCHMDPRTEITQEQATEIIERLAKCTEPYETHWGMGLSPENYMVVYPEGWHVYVNSKGGVRIIMELLDDVLDKQVKDTENIHDYLSDILAPALLKHVEDYKKMADEYNEKMFGVPPEEKV